MGGLHPLDSVMVPVSLADSISVQHCAVVYDDTGTMLDVRTDSMEVPSGQGNLADRAARAFAEAAGCRVELSMTIGKRIPTGAGLGGGSSDAAAVLNLLQGFVRGRMSNSTLIRIALELGSDVPFFLHPGAKRLVGIGDQMVPYEGPLPDFLVLCGDGTHLSTADVFRAYDSLTSVRPSSKKPDSVLARLDPLVIFNELEEAASVLHPGIAVVKSEMRQLGLDAVTMTGSGSVVFGVAEEWVKATRVAEELRGKGFWSTAVEVLG
jgi:4-diphosphocytidyl-2-C-methyl-D-erythritol kinase